MAMSKGCTVALIIVAVLAVIIIVGIILVYMNADKIKNAGIDYTVDAATTEIQKDLPEGYTEGYVNDLMTELKTKLKDGSVSAEKIQGLAQTFQMAMEDKILDVDESRSLLEEVQKLLGKEPPVMEEEMPDSLMTPEPAGA